ncbi:MAG: aspartate kinase [Acidobacteriota bacterium]
MTMQETIVQKFGGTSVSTSERRQQVVEQVRRVRDTGARVAIVVSAMGRRGDPYATDTLIDLLRADGGPVDPHDYTLMFVTGEIIATAMMSHTLRRAGIPAVGLSGIQARVYADGHPTEGEILEIDVSRLEQHLQRGEVPVVTGGQGASRPGLDFSTLGRGASDTSGVAIGVALGAVKAEIFTDVEGIAITDPRTVPQARMLQRISYASMHEMARFGAKVIHPRAVMTGWKGRTPVVVRSTFSFAPGTYIGDVADESPIVGLTLLARMETVAIDAGAVPTLVREEWERRRVIMSTPDDETGRLLVGISADRSADIDSALADAGITAPQRLGVQAWLSSIGDSQALAARTTRDLDCVRGTGATLVGRTSAEGRSTFVIDDSHAPDAVRSLYDDIFA